MSKEYTFIRIKYTRPADMATELKAALLDLKTGNHWTPLSMVSEVNEVVILAVRDVKE